MQSIWISRAACGVMLLGGGHRCVAAPPLPHHYLDDHARDIIRLGAGLVGTIAALVLARALKGA